MPRECTTIWFESRNSMVADSELVIQKYRFKNRHVVDFVDDKIFSDYGCLDKDPDFNLDLECPIKLLTI